MADELDGIAEKHVAEIEALEVMQTGVKGGELKRETRMGLAESAGASLSQEGLAQYLDDFAAATTEALATKKDDVMVKRGDLNPEMKEALDQAYAAQLKPSNPLDDVLRPSMPKYDGALRLTSVFATYAPPGSTPPTPKPENKPKGVTLPPPTRG